MTTRHNVSTADEISRGAAHMGGATPDGRRGVTWSHLVKVDFGAVAAADPDGILNDASATDSVQTYAVADFEVAANGGVLDVARNITAVGTAGADHVVTVTGTDHYGHTVVENLTLNGTNAIAGQKAFKTVTGVSVAAGAAGDTFDLGWGDILGLPYRLANVDDLCSSAVDGSVEDVTIAVADANTATATTGDVRGTVDFTQASNGSLRFSLVMEVDASDKLAAYGVDQFAG